MRAAGHQSLAVPHRQLGGCVSNVAQVAGNQMRGLEQLHRHRRVVEVLARHAEVHVASLGLTDGCVDVGEERDHVVSDALLQRSDAAGVEGRVPDLRQRRRGDAPDLGPGLAGKDLDPEP